MLSELLGTWLYDAIHQIGEYEASTGRIFATLEKSPVQHVYGLPGDGIPERYAGTFRHQEDGSVCVLLNLTHTSVPSVLDGPLSPIHLINVKLLTNAEARLVIDEADSGPCPAAPTLRRTARAARVDTRPPVSRIARRG